jgi:hypothetical protein
MIEPLVILWFRVTGWNEDALDPPLDDRVRNTLGGAA